MTPQPLDFSPGGPVLYKHTHFLFIRPLFLFFLDPLFFLWKHKSQEWRLAVNSSWAGSEPSSVRNVQNTPKVKDNCCCCCCCWWWWWWERGFLTFLFFQVFCVLFHPQLRLHLDLLFIQDVLRGWHNQSHSLYSQPFTITVHFSR